MDNRQRLRVGGKGATTARNVPLSEAPNPRFVFLGPAFPERVASAPSNRAYKTLPGRLVNRGITVREPESTLGHEPRTQPRRAGTSRRHTPDVVVRAFAGPGAMPPMTAAVAAFGRGRYAPRKGTGHASRRRLAAEVRICFGAALLRAPLRRLFVDRSATAMAAAAIELCGPAEWGWGVAVGCAAAGSRGTAPVIAAGCAVGSVALPVADMRDSGCPTTAVSCRIGPGSDNPSPTPPGESGTGATPAAAGPGPGPGLEGGGRAVVARPQAVPHAGQVRFSPWPDPAGSGRDPALDRQARWRVRILRGAVSIEPSKGICAASLSRFTAPAVPGPGGPRQRRWEQGPPAVGLEALAATARLPASGPGTGWRIGGDPHPKRYRGQWEPLKGWCGRRHRVEKVLHPDMIHTAAGEPCFVAPDDNVDALRERVFMTLRRFDERFPAGLRAGRLLVPDRGIFGRDRVELFFDRGDGLVTGQKGYPSGTRGTAGPAFEFGRTRWRNRAEDVRGYRFRCQASRRPQGGRVRPARVRTTNPDGRTIAVSGLCPDPCGSLDAAAPRRPNRWIEQNDCRSLDRHVGRMPITTCAAVASAETEGRRHDRPQECPEYRERQSRRQQDEQACGQRRVQREKLEPGRDTCTRERRRLERQRDRLTVQVAAAPERVLAVGAASPARRRPPARPGPCAAAWPHGNASRWTGPKSSEPGSREGVQPAIPASSTRCGPENTPSRQTASDRQAASPRVRPLSRARAAPA